MEFTDNFTISPATIGIEKETNRPPFTLLEGTIIYHHLMYGSVKIITAFTKYVYPTSALLGIVLNSLILVIMFSSQMKKRAFVVLSAALGITDNLVLIIHLLSYLPGHFDHIQPLYHCKSQMYLTSFLGHLSAWTTGLISVERFLVIYFPIKIRFGSRKQNL